MRLNELKPAVGSRSSARRVGRGNASGHGKTCGRGHKGQRSRSGGFHKIGFEGGQMPLQRRLPKRGFSSRKSRSRAEVRLDELNTLPGEVVTLRTLIGASIVSAATRYVKVINSGKLEKPIRLQGIGTSSGARAAIESIGGKVEG